MAMCFVSKSRNLLLRQILRKWNSMMRWGCWSVVSKTCKSRLCIMPKFLADVDGLMTLPSSVQTTSDDVKHVFQTLHQAVVTDSIECRVQVKHDTENKHSFCPWHSILLLWTLPSWDMTCFSALIWKISRLMIIVFTQIRLKIVSSDFVDDFRDKVYIRHRTVVWEVIESFDSFFKTGVMKARPSDFGKYLKRKRC